MGMGKICVTSRLFVAALIVAANAACLPAHAGSEDAGNDWGSNWSFASPSEQTLGLLKADLIAKQEHDYYDGLGKVNMNVTYDNRQGSFDNINASGNAQVDSKTHLGSEIGQNTNVIGAVNNSTTTVDIKGNNSTATITNGAASTGCLNGGITTIDGSSAASVAGLSC